MASKAARVDALIDHYGQTFAIQAGITVRNTPSPLVRLLCLATLLSARISAGVAVAGARAFADEG